MKKCFIFLLLPVIFYFSLPVAHSLEQIEKQAVVELLMQLGASYSKVNDYSATMRLESFEPNYQQQNQNVWFKKTGYLLIEQLGPFKKGAMLSILPNGIIKGHLGGFMSFAVVTLDKTDKNLYGITHDSALTTDYDKILAIAISMLPGVTDYSIKRIMIEQKERIVLSTSYLPDSKSHNGLKIDRTHLIIDPQSMFIIGLERYRKDKLIHKITWQKLKINTGIKKSRFHL